MRFAKVAFVLMVAAAAPAAAQTYNFDVQYFGNGVTSLAPGSDDPTGTNVLPTDTFFWRIAAQGGAFWKVQTGGDFFPLMAFAVNEPGARTGDFTLNLFRNGVNTFTGSAFGSVQQYAHMGTNTVTLGTGYEFDTMELTYQLLSAIDTYNGTGADINSTISGPLPIFGAPEQNIYFPGITYEQNVVPEPGTYALMGTGLGLVALVARRRKK